MNASNFQNLLIDLKEKYGAIALRADLASGSISTDELISYNKLAKDINLDLTIKIGGCDATSDIFNAKKIQANSIIAPMIETPYALKKFIINCQKVYKEEELLSINLYPNIETINAFNNFDDIFSIPEASYIKGIVLGRDDMVGSMGLSREDINSQAMLQIAQTLQDKIQKLNKEFILGGEIRHQAIPFIESLGIRNSSRYETRMIVFKDTNNIEEQIILATEFEIKWLEAKINKTNYDLARINKLKLTIPNQIH